MTLVNKTSLALYRRYKKFGDIYSFTLNVKMSDYLTNGDFILLAN